MNSKENVKKIIDQQRCDCCPPETDEVKAVKRNLVIVFLAMFIVLTVCMSIMIIIMIPGIGVSAFLLFGIFCVLLSFFVARFRAADVCLILHRYFQKQEL